jgi:hypothetical protein
VGVSDGVSDGVEVKFRVTPTCHDNGGDGPRVPILIVTVYGPATIQRAITPQEARDLARALNDGADIAERETARANGLA